MPEETKKDGSMRETTISRREFTVGITATALMSVLGLWGCSSAGGSSSSSSVPSSQRESFTITDAKGRSVEIPGTVSKVMCLHPFVTFGVWRLGGIDSLVSVDTVFKSIYIGDNCTPYFNDADKAALNALQVTNMFSKGVDAEQVMSLAPDVVITITGDPNCDSLQQTTGIPVICCAKSPVAKQGESFRTIGKIMDNEADGNAMGDMLDKITGRITKEVSALSDSAKPRVMYCGKSGDLLAVPGKDSVYGTVLDTAGGRSVSDELAETTNEAISVTIEQIMNWDPEVIICQTQAEQSTILGDAAWAGLTAVKDKKVYVPLQYCDVDGWPAVLGLDWVNYALLHGGDSSALRQVQDDMSDFYQLFTYKTLSNDELNQVAITW